MFSTAVETFLANIKKKKNRKKTQSMRDHPTLHLDTN